jgi:polyphosphate kinase
MTMRDPSHFINRDLSWLEFNGRVLAEAENGNVPLLERLKFAAIVSNNLDEFFMVRVALAARAWASRTAVPGPDMMSPEDILLEVAEKSHELVTRQYACVQKQLFPSLANEGIDFVRCEDYTEDDHLFLSRHFQEHVLPVLTPLAVDQSHPFPLLTSGAVYILFKVRPSAGSAQEDFYAQADTVLVQVPRAMNRFVALPSQEDRVRMALLDDVIIPCASMLLGGYVIDGAYPFRVTRDADFTVDDQQAEDLLTAVEQEVRLRRWGAPVRLEIGDSVPDDIMGYLQNALELSEDDTYRVSSMINLKSLFGLLELVDRPDLLYEPWPSHPHPALGEDVDLFEVIRKRDVVVYHPFQSFDPVLRLVAQAADDPSVLAIKITLYRVSGDSPIVRSLIQAAEADKQVTVLLELRARFDEEANIQWARRLDAAGAHVIYGVVGYKTHAKALLVVRREQSGIRRYVHLSTGNYNDRTARQYTDVGYFTARPDFGVDISSFFNVITGYSLPPTWNHIEIAPTGLRRRFLSLIEREIEKHSKETPGLIRAKMNSLIDSEVIDALYRAGQAGVKVELVVRGLCCLRPGVKKLSENIQVISIVDRFLEHPRIYHFGNGGNDEVYLSSADWMERNLDRRIELIFPILDSVGKAHILHILDVCFKDNTNAWTLKDCTYARKSRRGRQKRLRSQELLYREAGQMVAKPLEETERIFRTKMKPDG